METKVIIIPDGKICDYIDGKFRNDTPEEYVRQTVEKRLVNEHKYSRDRICVEYTVQIGSGKKRADIVIFSDEEIDKKQENIKIIIDCKIEKIEANNAKDVVAQLQGVKPEEVALALYKSNNAFIGILSGIIAG